MHGRPMLLILVGFLIAGPGCGSSDGPARAEAGAEAGVQDGGPRAAEAGITPPAASGPRRWQRETVSVTGDLQGVWARSASDVWVAGSSTLLHWDGVRWQAQAGSGRDVWGTRGASPEVWTVGEEFRRLSAGTWQSELKASDCSEVFNEIWGVTRDELWIAGASVGDCPQHGNLYHWRRGIGWKSERTTSMLQGVSGTAPDNVWVLGDGNLSRWDGTALRPEPTAEGCWGSSIWAASAEEVWIGVNAGQICRRQTGGTWQKLSTGQSNVYFASIWGAHANDVWIVGSSGAVWHWDGTSLQRAAEGLTTETLQDVSGADGHVWIVGEKGTLLHGSPL